MSLFKHVWLRLKYQPIYSLGLLVSYALLALLFFKYLVMRNTYETLFNYSVQVSRTLDPDSSSDFLNAIPTIISYLKLQIHKTNGTIMLISLVIFLIFLLISLLLLYFRKTDHRAMTYLGISCKQQGLIFGVEQMAILNLSVILIMLLTPTLTHQLSPKLLRSEQDIILKKLPPMDLERQESPSLEEEGMFQQGSEDFLAANRYTVFHLTASPNLVAANTPIFFHVVGLLSLNLIVATASSIAFYLMIGRFKGVHL